MKDVFTDIVLALTPLPEARELSENAAAIYLCDHFAPEGSRLAETMAGDLELQQTDDHAFMAQVRRAFGGAR
jgi:hypothetical protein